MAALVENFINLYFNKIKDEITKGTKKQALEEQLEWRKCEFKDKDTGESYMDYPHWNVIASDSSILECIRCFFFLCRNAGKIGTERKGKIGKEHKMVEQWIENLLNIACMPALGNVTSCNEYSRLIGASDQITKFLFGCFDWNINQINEKHPLQKSYLEEFNSRVRYYTNCCKKCCWPTAKLLYSLKDERNDEAHYGFDFWSNRDKSRKRLYYSLFDYITVFYMICNVCRENGNKINIKQSVREATKMPDSFLMININIECIDESCGKPVPERKSDLMLYRIDNWGNKTEVNVDSKTPGKFQVKFFEKYIISIVTGGKESEPSETFIIDKDFIDGITVKVNIPPQTLAPQKISISEIVLSDQELPENVRLFLESIKEFVGEDSVFAECAMSMTIAATTKNEANMKTFEEAMKNLKASIEKQKENNDPNVIRIELQGQIKNIQNSLASVYKDGDEYKEDFLELCECINKLYACYDKSDYDDNTTNIDQITQNSEAMVSGKRFTIVTTATDESIKQQQQLTELNLFLKMKDRYPEIIEAEAPGLFERIEQLYVDQINFYRPSARLLGMKILELYSYLNSHVDKNRPDEKRTLKYVELVHGFLSGSAEDMIKTVQLCGDMMLVWISQCKSEDEKTKELIEQCEMEIRDLKNNRKLLLPMIYIKKDDERNKIKKAYNIICQCVDNYKKHLDKVEANLHDCIEPLSDARLNINLLEKFMKSFSPESFMQLVCGTSSGASEIANLFFKSMDFDIYPHLSRNAYKALEKVNRPFLWCCIRVIRILWENFSEMERRRIDDEFYATGIELNNVKAERIVEYQRQQIEKIYGDESRIPDFLSDIINASTNMLPNHIKAMLLRGAAVADRSDTERLLYVIDGVIRHVRCSSVCENPQPKLAFFSDSSTLRKALDDVRSPLERYISGEYSKRLVSEEAFDDFIRMPLSSQLLYLDILLDKKPFFNGHYMAALVPSVRYIMAYKLNFANGGYENGIMEPNDFFLIMSVMREGDIRPDHYQWFVNLVNIVGLVSKFSIEHPDDERLKHCSDDQSRWFYGLCSKYYLEHLEICPPIKDGEWNLGYLDKASLHWILNGLPLHKQIIAKYRYLYECCDREKRTSGWYKREKEQFDDIVSQMKDMDLKYQQEISRRLIDILSHEFPHDIQAERYMVLKPFCDEKKFQDILRDFHIVCEKRLIIRSFPEGLNVIRELFSGEDVKISWLSEDSKPTDFVDVLIGIDKLYGSNFQKQNTP